MKMKYLLIALVISIISIGAVSASENINITASDVKDMGDMDMEVSEISLETNDQPSVDSIKVEDIDYNTKNIDYSDIISKSEQSVTPTAYKLVNEISVNPTDFTLVNDISPTSLSITADFTKEINIDKFMNIANNQDNNKDNKPVVSKNSNNTNNTNETNESPLPETGIPVYMLILVIFMAIGVYRKD